MPTECLTPSNVLGFRCPEDKGQAFLWDTTTQGLGVRATRRGQNTFVFQRRQAGKPIRKVIGGTDRLSLAEARTKALEMQSLIDGGAGPAKATPEEANFRASNHALTFGQLWKRYLQLGRPLRSYRFSARYHTALLRAVQPGSEPKRKGEGHLLEGPLHPLVETPIEDLNDDRLRSWHDGQAQRNASQAARALVMLRGFLRWCQTQSEFVAVTQTAREAAASLTLKVGLTVKNPRTSTIDRSKLPAWWAQVLKIENIQLRVYLKFLLVTGLNCTCASNLNRRALQFRAKFGASIQYFDRGKWHRHPLTDDATKLVRSLPRAWEIAYIFSGKGEKDRMPDPRAAFRRTLIAAGIEPVPIYAIQRTFAALALEADVPSKVVAQCTRSSMGGNRPKKDRMDFDEVRQHLVRYEQHLKRVLGVSTLI